MTYLRTDHTHRTSVRFTYGARDNIFFSRSEEDIENAIAACKPWKPCVSCGRKKLNAADDRWSYKEASVLMHGDIPYHQHDFCYIRPDVNEPAVYVIGQILNIHTRQRDGDRNAELSVDVRVYGREDAVIKRERMDTFGPVKTDNVSFALQLPSG